MSVQPAPVQTLVLLLAVTTFIPLSTYWRPVQDNRRKVLTLIDKDKTAMLHSHQWQQMSLEDKRELWNMKEPIFYSLERVADMLQVSERTVMREIKAGKIRAFKVGRSLRFTPEAVQEYVRRQEVKPGDGLEENAQGPDAA